MIDYERFARIRHLKEQKGLNASQIARQLDLDARTVRRWLAEHFRARKPAARPSKLDPFKNDIRRMLEQYPYSAAQIFQRIGQMGLTEATPSSNSTCAVSGRQSRRPF